MIFIAAVLLAMISFYIQVRPRLKNRYFGVDGWRHLSVADYLRRHKRYPGHMEQFLIKQPSDYPPGLRIILSVIPKKILDKYEWAFCPAVDFCHNLFLFAFVYYFSRNYYLAYLSQITYMLAPLTVMENSNLTTRPLASFLFTLTFISMLGYALTAKIILFVLAVFFVSLLLLSHRMAVQALFFLVIAVTLADKTFVYFSIFLSGLLLAVIISNGFYLKILEGHIGMLRYWRINIKYRYAHEVRGLPKGNEKGKDTVYNIYQFIRKAPFLAVLGANPFVVFAALFFFLNTKNVVGFSCFGFEEELVKNFLFWISVLFIIAVIVRQVRLVEFIGEGERYLEYASFPISIITGLVVLNGLNSSYKVCFLAVYAVTAVCFCLIPFLMIQNKVVVKDTIRSVREPLKRIFDYINQSQEEVKMMCIPLCMTTAVMYFTKAKVLSTDNSIAHITDLSDILPVIRKPFNEIFKKYGLNYLLVNEDYVKLDELNLIAKEVVKREGSLVLLKV